MIGNVFSLASRIVCSAFVCDYKSVVELTRDYDRWKVIYEDKVWDVIDDVLEGRIPLSHLFSSEEYNSVLLRLVADRIVQKYCGDEVLFQVSSSGIRLVGVGSNGLVDKINITVVGEPYIVVHGIINGFVFDDKGFSRISEHVFSGSINNAKFIVRLVTIGGFFAGGVFHPTKRLRPGVVREKIVPVIIERMEKTRKSADEEMERALRKLSEITGLRIGGLK